MIPLNLSAVRKQQLADACARWHLDIPQGTNVPKHLLEDFGIYLKALLTTVSKIERLASHLNGWTAERVRQETWAITQSHSVRLAAVLVVSRGQKRFKQRLSRAHAESIADLAKTIKGQVEPIVSKAITKNGKTRTVHEFGIVRTVQQTILSWLLQVTLPHNPFDYSAAGHKGIHGAARYIGECLETGTRFWGVWDIVSAYPSVRMSHLRSVCNLDERLVRHIAFPVIHPDQTTKDSSTMIPTAKVAQRQLPQGAVHSPLILSALIGGCLRDSSFGKFKIALFADNGAFGAHSEQRALDAIEALKKALEAHPAGPLMLHECMVCDGYAHSGFEKGLDGILRQNGVDFCGYRISYDTPSGQVRYRPSFKAFKKMRQKLRENVFHPSMEEDELKWRATILIKDWAKGFPLWKVNEISWSSLQQTIAQEIALACSIWDLAKPDLKT